MKPSKDAKILGEVRNQFWMDEYNGELRVCAVINLNDSYVGSKWQHQFSYKNKIYILSENLAVLTESDYFAQT